MTYKILRMFMDSHPTEVIRTGLTLEEAQAHCRDRETSSSTATTTEAMELLPTKGPWFDGYEED